ncbi:MAG: flotillin-like FloA family protein, partial [Candidatus Riflebacteria bacterium]|nr:flotillin-like FloA family protein [Candidatus Riflebacteria bacterium]
DKKVGEAKAEGRRALAMALTQENRAAEQQAKANLVQAEMKVPLALAETFRNGKILVSRKKRPAPVDRAGLGFGDDAG